MTSIVMNGICGEITLLSNGSMFCKSCGMSCNCRPFAHAWSGIFICFCLELFLQCIQIYSFITYMSSCSTSSGTNCGYLCVVTSSFSWDVCLCSFMTYQCDNILLLSHYLYHSLPCESCCTVLWNNMQW